MWSESAELLGSPSEASTLTLDLNDLDLSEVEVEVLSNADARALPEMGATVAPLLCCTVCCCCCS